MKIEKYSKYAPCILRSGIAIVFLWFGFSQLINPSGWTRMIPSYASWVPLSTINLIYLHGIFEILLATLLLLGLYTRTAALLLTLNILHITWIVGYGPTGARDLAISLATLSIFLHGKDEYCLDNYINKNK